MCELCDARALKRAVDAVGVFKPQSPPALPAETSSSSTESAASWVMIDDSPAEKKRKVEKEQDHLYALLPGSTSADIPVLAKLVEWAKDNGAILHEKVEIYASPSHEVKLRVKPVAEDEAVKEAVHATSTNAQCSRAEATTTSINAQHALPAHSHIVTSPLATSLSYLNALDTFPTFPSHAGVTRNFVSSWTDTVSPRTVGVFFLMQQYLLGDASFWAPYIKSLPQPRFEHLSLRACGTRGEWGPFPLRWDIRDAAGKSVCFDIEKDDCECYDQGLTMEQGWCDCQKLKRMPKNPYTPMKENEGRRDVDYFNYGWGSSALDWSDQCEDDMSNFVYTHEEGPDNSEDEEEVAKYHEDIGKTEPLYWIHWEREVIGPIYEWAQAIFYSRSFPSSILLQATYGLEPLLGKEEAMALREKLEKVGPFPVLLPLMDMVNHQPGAKVDMLVNGALAKPTAEETFSGGMKERRNVEIGPKDVPSVGLVNGTDIPASGEIAFDYKPKTLEEMLLGFGYERGKRKLATDVRMEVVTKETA